MNTKLVLATLNKTESNLDYLQENYNIFREKYNNKFIAIKDRNVIAVGDDMQKLLRYLKESGEDPSEIVIEFVSKIPVIF